MRVFGRTQTFRAAITEPEPGRVLVETDLDTNGAVTTFTVNPGPVQGTADVTIATELPVRAGILGVIERALSTRFLRRFMQENWYCWRTAPTGENRINAFLPAVALRFAWIGLVPE